MSLQSLMTDTVFIEKADGTRTGPFKTRVTENSASIFDPALDVIEGEHLIKVLPGNKEASYLVTDADHSSGIPGAIPPHWTLKLRKTTSISAQPTKHTTVNINNSSGFQVGDNNTMHITNAIKELQERIDSSEATPAEKQEAKGRLASALGHPLVVAILGSAVGSLMSK